MIQSFSIVFAGYKMPACLRPGLSSSSPLAVTWPGLGLRSVPITGTIRHYTLYSTLSHTPYSHLLSTLSIDQWPQTNIRHWRDVKEDASCVAGLGLFLASHEQGITGDSTGRCQTGRDGYKQETSVKLISSIPPRICVTNPWWGWAWESLYQSWVSAGTSSDSEEYFFQTPSRLQFI